MTVSEAARFFEKMPKIFPMLHALEQVGLGYVKLGQSGAALSGGEAQRVKLAAELAKRSTGRTLYLLDEPTTGLHFADIQTLLVVLFRLRDAGNTLIVIEHNLDVIKCADWIVDLGPGGGSEGGELVATGTPEQVAENERSATGRFLRKVLSGDDRNMGTPAKSL
jgi:excinuclease ABC subunit A